MSEDKPISETKSGEAKKVTDVIWDDKNMQTTYANVVNMSSTREEVSVFFGTNQTWNFQEQNKVTVKLTNRIVLNPFAAKRLLVLLNRTITEYEKRFVSLNIEGEAEV